jgi:hypothetical protein
MVLIQCPTDRWQAHRDIATRFAKSSDDRGHLWRFVGEGEAKVRLADEPLEILDEGAAVSFRIDCVPVKKVKGKRREFPLTDDVLTEWFLTRLGTALEIEEISCRVMSFTIARDGDAPFSRPCVRYVGKANVLDRKELEYRLRNGIGDAKAYGFGLLEIEGIA